MAAPRISRWEQHWDRKGAWDTFSLQSPEKTHGRPLSSNQYMWSCNYLTVCRFIPCPCLTDLYKRGPFLQGWGVLLSTWNCRFHPHPQVGLNVLPSGLHRKHLGILVAVVLRRWLHFNATWSAVWPPEHWRDAWAMCPRRVVCQPLPLGDCRSASCE